MAEVERNILRELSDVTYGAYFEFKSGIHGIL